MSQMSQLSQSQTSLQDTKFSTRVFMIQRKITNPSPQQLKIMTQLQENIPEAHRPQENFKLAQITIYTENATFEGELKGKCIAKQLSWNSDSMKTLLDCLKGKRDKVEFKFYPISKSANNEKQINSFEIVCEISSGINLTLFTIEMRQPSPFLNPFFHMKQKFASLQDIFRNRQKSYKQQEEKLKSELNQIQAVEKQILYSSTTEISLMKKEFIKHVNKEKAKIRKLMGSVPMINPVSGLIENRVGNVIGNVNANNANNELMNRIVEKPSHQEEDKNERTQSMKKKKNKGEYNRHIKKVDKDKYERSLPQKIQIESSSLSSDKYYTSSSPNNNHNNQHLIDQNGHTNDDNFDVHCFQPRKQQQINGHGRINEFQKNRKKKFAADDENDSSQEQYQDNISQNRFRDNLSKGREKLDQGKTFLELEREKIQKQKTQKYFDNKNINGKNDNGANEDDWNQLFN